MRYDFGTGGWDIEFEIATISSGESVTVIGGMELSLYVIPSDADTTTLKTLIVLTEQASGSKIEVINDSDVTLRTFYSDRTLAGKIRVIAHGSFVTVYLNDGWACTFHFDHVLYRETRYVAMKSADGITVTNVRLKELADWREAIFIDLESSGMNAITSVILQRPVDMWPTWDGKLSFSFDPERDTVSLVKAKKHRKGKSLEEGVASDAIAYFTNVAVIVTQQVAEDYGFITRLVRLPDLDQDAIQSTKIIVDDAIRRSTMGNFSARYNPQLELGDKARMQFTRVDTGTAIDETVIVEDMRFVFADGVFNFEGNGRDGS